MIKLTELVKEQDNTTSAKEWRKVEKAITRGMDAAFDKGVKYLRDYERSNLPANEKKMLSDFFDNYFLLKNRFQKINKHLVTKKHLKEKFTGISDSGPGYSNKEAQNFSQDAVNKAAKEIGKAQQRAVTIFTSDMKNKKYDNMDLARSIRTGNIRDASFSKRDVLKQLYYDVRDRFNKYNRRKKN